MQVNWCRNGVQLTLWARFGLYGQPTASGVRCPAIQLLDVDGAPFMTASVNIPDYPLQEGEILIKNYSENEGVLDALIEAGVVEKPHGVAHSGYVQADVCRLRREQ